LRTPEYTKLPPSRDSWSRWWSRALRPGLVTTSTRFSILL
jgi:hypothetical protein